MIVIYKLELTKEELKTGLTQINARLDVLENIQKEHGKKEDIKRVLEMEEFMNPIRSFRDKIMNALCS